MRSGLRVARWKKALHRIVGRRGAWVRWALVPVLGVGLALGGWVWSWHGLSPFSPGGVSTRGELSGRVRVDVGWVTREARGEAIPVVVVRRTGAPWEVCAVEWDEAGRAALRIVEAPEWGLQEVGFGELERSVVTRGRWNRVTGRWVSGHSVVTNIFPLRYDVMPGHVKAWTDVQMESILRGVVERLGSVEFDPYTATMVAAFGAEREGEIIVRRARGEALIRSVGVVRAMLSWWWWLLLSAVLIGVWRRVVGQRLRRRRLGALRVLCPACGYRAGTARAAVCSECGHVLDRRLGPAVPTA